MARQFFVERIGGWVTPLPEKAGKEIQLRWPQVPIHEIQSEFGYYVLTRDANSRGQEPAQVRRRYMKMAKRAEILAADVQWLRDTNLGAMVEQVGVEVVEYGTLDRLLSELEALPALMRAAEKYIPEGYQITPRQALIWNLATIVSRAGLPVDAHPNGAVCSIADTLFEAAGETVSNIASVVGPVVEAFLKNSSEMQT